MKKWSSDEVMNFLEYRLPEFKIYLKKFKCISGYIFKTLSEDYCQLLSNSRDIGSLIYKIKENYLQKYNYGKLKSVFFFIFNAISE